MCDCVWVMCVCSGVTRVCVFRECVWGEEPVVICVCVCLRIKDDYFN